MMAPAPALAFPTGYTFEPEDEDLIEHYLGPKVRGEQTLHVSFIPELDVYATEPWNLGVELRHGRNRDAFFCFTRATRSGASNGRLLRGAGDGTWHASGKKTLIRCNGAVTGQKMTNLKFMLRAKNGGKPAATSWIMHEYRLLDPPVDDQGREMVLYRIQKSGTGLSDDRQQLSCLDDFPASAPNQQLRKRKRDQIQCYKIATATTTSCSTPAPPPYIACDEQRLGSTISVWEDPVDASNRSDFQFHSIMELPSSGDDAAFLFCGEMAAPAMRTITSWRTPASNRTGDEQPQDSIISVWEDPVDTSKGSDFLSQSMMQLPYSGEDAASLFSCEMAAPAIRAMRSYSTPPPYIIGDEQLQDSTMSVWEDPVDISKGSDFQFQSMMQLPCSVDDAAPFFNCEIAAGYPAMGITSNWSTSPCCIVGDEQPESVRTSMSVQEDLVDISQGPIIQSQPMMQPLCSGDDYARQPEKTMEESTIVITLPELDWNDSDLDEILEMIEKGVP